MTYRILCMIREFGDGKMKTPLGNFGDSRELQEKNSQNLVFSTAIEKLNQMTFGVMLTLHMI